ncbi:acyl-CoA N-acyltransferase [Coprinellus micaceus]|uniref:Acyl-CoA N-acyltransferase n=1 Tax=Coprinellus micaceus TaxID=71717 RepID=A0A4Y7T412_COPMI|nr:acyl-CoA N-acyltransferase [Coprinellus micaceus]
MSSPSLSPKLVTLTSTSPTSRVYLRSPTPSDAENLFARAKDPKCNTYVPFLQSDACTLESTHRSIARWRTNSYISSLVVVIVNKATNAVIGDTGFQGIDFEKKTGELGIMIDSDPAIRGNGYAIEILDILFSYGFHEKYLGLEKVVFFTSGDNVPMREVLKRKLGLEERYREEEQDWEYVADKAWWTMRREGGVVAGVVEEIWNEHDT